MRSWQFRILRTVTVFVLGIVLSTGIASQAFAIQKNKDGSLTIDIGAGEVQGSVRKPQLRVVESQATVNALLPDTYRREFEAAEAEFTRPAVDAKKGLGNGTEGR